MYGYAQSHRLNDLKMQIKNVYHDSMARIAKAEADGDRSLDELDKHYEDRLDIMRRDHDQLRQMHAKTMSQITRNARDLAVKLQAARERAAAQKGG